MKSCHVMSWPTPFTPSHYSKLTPLKVSSLLNRLYREFDLIVHRYALFRVETVGGMCE